VFVVPSMVAFTQTLQVFAEEFQAAMSHAN
jgi:hypothetical protein